MLVHNAATTFGGGLVLFGGTAVLTNTLIADNWAGANGYASGIYIGNSSTDLLHTTIARNRGGDGSGVYVYALNANLTNTILVSQTVGVSVATGTVTLEGSLWGSGEWANGADWGGQGTILTGAVNVWGDPMFVDSDAGDYHIGFGSAARDAGVNAGVTTDIDGDPRPVGSGFDIGADEYVPAYSVYLPVVMKQHP